MRTLLSVAPNPLGTGIYGSHTYIGCPLQATEFDASAITVDPGATVIIDVQVFGSGTPAVTPTGSVYLSWGGDIDEGTGSVNVPLAGSDGEATGSTAFTVPSIDLEAVDENYISAEYSGDSYYAPEYLQNYTPTIDVNFTATNKLMFIQQPSNSAVGDTISPPVRVQEQLSDGSSIGDGTTPVTLSIASGNGTLAGTLTEPAINGVATFSDLSIDTGGSCTLTASGSTFTSTDSSLFDITAGKLVFTKAPHNGSAGAALDPAVTVSLEDARGKVITSDSSALVTLSPIGLTSGNPITGNTATLVNGVATFSDVKLNMPGFYQLQANDDSGDTQATSGKFKIAGDKLVFKAQPANPDANTGIPLTVAIEDSTNKIVTDASTTIVLTLNPTEAGSAAQLSGTTSLAFVNGIAQFTAAAGPMINTPGKYTITATEEDYSTGVLAPTNTTTSITTKLFTVGGLQLVFLKKPVPTDANAPLAFIVAVEDKQHKVDTSVDSGSVQFSLTAISGGVGATLSTYTNGGFVDGMDTFSGGNAPAIDTPGTYSLTATQLDAGGIPVATTATATASPLKILGEHLVFKKNLSSASVGQDLSFSVALEDTHGKVDTSDNTTEVTITAPGVSLLEGDTSVLTNGVATWNTGGTELSIPLAGTYHLIASAGQSIQPGTSANFKVMPYRLFFTEQPKNINYGDTTTFTVVEKDFKGDINTADSTSEISISQNASVTLSGGVYNFSGQLRSDALGDTLYVPATYTLTADQIGIGNGISPYGRTLDTSAVSAKFKVSGFHLVFSHQPVSASAGSIVGFTVAILDDKNQVVTSESPGLTTDGVSIMVQAISGGTPQTSGATQEDFESGSAPFGGQGEFSILTPGTYELVATEFTGVLGATTPVSTDVTQSATSIKFTIT